MSISAAALAALGAVGAAGMSSAGNMANSVINFAANKHLQEDNQRYNSAEAALARTFSHDEAQLQRDWSERMSNTSYQRAVADMEAAGLNPAAIGAGGSSLPSGAAGSANNASSNALGANVSNGNLFGNVPEIITSAFTNALAHDKSFGQDLLRNMSHSAHMSKVSINADKQLQQWLDDNQKFWDNY